MRLSKIEIDVVLVMIGDVDPAHFEMFEEPERTRREKAADRATEKLRRRLTEMERRAK